jgi:hypothetical protein
VRMLIFSKEEEEDLEEEVDEAVEEEEERMEEVKRKMHQCLIRSSIHTGENAKTKKLDRRNSMKILMTTGIERTKLLLKLQ